MKQIITILMLTYVLGLNEVSAQESRDEEKRVFSNEIHMGAIQIFIGEFYLHYEKQLKYNAFVASGSISNINQGDSHVTGWYGGMQYRRYYKKPNDIELLNGYFGAVAGYGFRRQEETTDGTTIKFLRIGIMVGTKVVLNEFVSIDFNLVNMYQFSEAEKDSGQPVYVHNILGQSYKGFRPQFNCTLGIRF